MAYLTGVVSAGELIGAVRGARDVALRRIVGSALQVRSVNPKPYQPLSSSTGLAACRACVPVLVMPRPKASAVLCPLQGALDENAAGQDALRRTAQLTANAAALAAAAPALDDFTLQRVR